jgi:hypothetical protein
VSLQEIRAGGEVFERGDRRLAGLGDRDLIAVLRVGQVARPRRTGGTPPADGVPADSLFAGLTPLAGFEINDAGGATGLLDASGDLPFAGGDRRSRDRPDSQERARDGSTH